MCICQWMPVGICALSRGSTQSKPDEWFCHARPKVSRQIGKKNYYGAPEGPVLASTVDINGHLHRLIRLVLKKSHAYLWVSKDGWRCQRILLKLRDSSAAKEDGKTGLWHFLKKSFHKEEFLDIFGWRCFNLEWMSPISFHPLIMWICCLSVRK